MKSLFFSFLDALRYSIAFLVVHLSVWKMGTFEIFSSNGYIASMSENLLLECCSILICLHLILKI